MFSRSARERTGRFYATFTIATLSSAFRFLHESNVQWHVA